MDRFRSGGLLFFVVLFLATPLLAAYTPATGESAGARMQKLGIVTGQPGGLDLNSEITRAELVSVIVRAFGKEEDSKLLRGSTVFPDIQNHWASGNIAMAVALVEKAGSDPIGMPDGKFSPDSKLTPAQAVAFLMKFLGHKPDPAKSWPYNYLDAAVENGLITAEDKSLIGPMLNENATRGLTFYLFDRAFMNYHLPAGKTFYTSYVDNTPPQLTLNSIPSVTLDPKVTVTGTVKDAISLHVGTTPIEFDASGNFSFEYQLPDVKDYVIVVTAADVAGNKTEKQLSITRNASAPQLTVIAPPEGAALQTAAPVLSGTTDWATSLEIYVDGSSTPATVSTVTPGAWSHTLASLADGPHTVLVRALNAAGQKAEVTRSFSVATSPAGITITSPIDASWHRSSPTISGTANANRGIELLESGSVFATGTSDESGKWSIATNLPAGKHSITAQIVDSTAAPAALTFTIGPSEPIVSIISPTEGMVLATGSVTVQISAEANLPIALFVDGVRRDIAANAFGAATVELTGLAPGPHKLVVYGYSGDAVVTPSCEVRFGVYPAESVLKILSPADGSVISQLRASGTAPPEAVLTMKLDGVMIGTQSTDGEGYWSWVGSTATDGPHTLEASLGTTVVTRSFIYDTLGPQWGSATLGAVPATTSVTLSWPTPDEANLREFVVMRGGAIVATLAPTAREARVINLAPGTAYEFEVRARDAAGNESQPLSRTVTTLAIVSEVKPVVPPMPPNFPIPLTPTRPFTVTPIGGLPFWTTAQLNPISVLPPSIAAPPPTLHFPFGVLDFSIKGFPPYGLSQLQVDLPAAMPAGSSWWKFGRTALNPVPHWHRTPWPINGDSVTIDVRDGSPSDDDGLANGSVTDPGGPALPVVDIWTRIQQVSSALVPGLPYEWTVLVGNTGPDDAATVSATISIPAGITMQSITTSGGTCTSAGACTFPLLTSGDFEIVTLRGVPSAAIATLDATASAPWIEADASNDASSLVPNAIVPPQSVSVADATAIEGSGNTMTFNVTLSAAAATPVWVSWKTADATAVAGADYTAGAGTLQFDAGVTTLPVTVAMLGDTVREGGETLRLQLTAAVNATIARSEAVGVIVDDDANADLRVTLNAPAAAVAGSNVTYVVEVTNLGPDPATNVQMTDTLPAGATFVSATPSQGTCTGTGPVVCTLGALAVNASAQVTLVLRAPAAATTMTNNVAVIAAEADLVPANNSASGATTVSVTAIPVLSPAVLAMLMAALAAIALMKVRGT